MSKLVQSEEKHTQFMPFNQLHLSCVTEKVVKTTSKLKTLLAVELIWSRSKLENSLIRVFELKE